MVQKGHAPVNYSLPGQQAMVFYGNISEFNQADCRHALTESEITRSSQFLHDPDKCRYLISRAIIKQLLSRFLSANDKTIELCYEKNGKPFLQNYPGLQFNISHTDDVLVIGIANNMDIGVDIENLCRSVNISTLKSYLFTPGELKHFNSIHPDQKKETFIKSWVKKEALLKASGKGLTQAMNTLDVAFTNAKYFSLKTKNEDQKNKEGYFIESYTPALLNNYHLSVAVKGEIKNIQYIPFNESGFLFK